MNKIVKKAMAAALALTIVGGGIPALSGGIDIFKPAIVANAEVKKVALTNVSVDLDDSITLKFYATKESVDAAGVDSVTLTGSNDQINLTSFKTDVSGKNYVFSYPLYANQLDENITIKFKKGTSTALIIAGGNNYTNYTYSINSYCDAVIDTTVSDSTKNMVKSLKNLGIAADNYFDGTEIGISFLDSDYDLSDFAPMADADVKFSLVLDSKLSARVYIPDLPDSGKYDNYSAIKGKGGKNCFEISNIKPTDLDEEYVFEYGSHLVLFKPLAFCYRAITNNSENSEIAKAIYEYYEYAKAYEYDHPTIYVDCIALPYRKTFKIERGMTWRELFVNNYDAQVYNKAWDIPVGA